MTKSPHSLWSNIHVVVCVVCSSFLYSCNKMQSTNHTSATRCNDAEVTISKVNDTLSFMHYVRHDSILSEWRLPFATYRLECADFDGDGKEDIVVGVIKKSRHFGQVDKRLFLFRVNEYDHIRPLWFASRVGDGLVDFRVEHDSVPARIITTNKTNSHQPNDSCVEMQLKLGTFGLEFEKFIPNKDKR